MLGKRAPEEPLIKDLEQILVHKDTPIESWQWMIGATGIRHHPTQPAIEFKNGNWMWYWMGKEHRLDGPSSYWDGNYQYWIHGEQFTEIEWERHPRRLEWLRNQTERI